MSQFIFPQTYWNQIIGYIQSIGEGNRITRSDMSYNDIFLTNIGLIEDEPIPKLTKIGKALFHEVFIRGNKKKEKEILRNCLLSYSPVLAIQQNLWGLKSVTISQVLTVLKSTGHCNDWYPHEMERFLELLDWSGIIRFDQKNYRLSVLVPPSTEILPNTIYIDPERPFSNVMWIKRVLKRCQGFIYWLDKHFEKSALEWLWEIANADKISEIRILSLDCENNVNKVAKKDYKRLNKELKNKGIDLIWAVIDSKSIRDTHDRWIISKDYAVNVPNVNAIASGQRSEMNKSENPNDIKKAFQKYWSKSKEI